jgi:tetratricopeptide (TPR) repeat protein
MPEERFRIVRELGSGAMAQVSLALDTTSQRLVALKRLHRIYAVSGGARLRREFRALSRLDHPNIVRVYDHGDLNNLPFLALEFVDGVTLGAWLETGRDMAQIVAVFAQVADALEAAHAAGLIHRDLKPENIMVTADGTVKLMDFGLTKLLEASVAITREGAMVGTVLYMSPEQCRGQELDARADVYALGAVLYRALTGVPPFIGTSLTGVILQHLNARPKAPRALNANIPPALEALVLRMLAKDAGGRPRSALEVATRLRQITAPLNVAPEPVSSGASVRLLRGPLVGRALELRALEEALEFPAPGYIALVGEAGSGKTRLLQDLEADVPIIVSSARSDDTRAFAPIERLVSNLKRDAPHVLHALEPFDVEVLSQLEASVSGDAAMASTRRFEAFRVLLEAASGVVVLVLENMQWADASTLSMLTHAIRGASRARLVLTYRPEDIAGDRPRLLPASRVTVRLKPLSASDMHALLEARLGGATEVGLRDALLERAGGNPWALEELLRDMLTRGAILEQSGVFEWDRSQFGGSLLGAFGERLQHLAAAPRAFAEAAAVLGREFRFEDARALLDWEDEPALDALEALLTAKVLLERPSGDEFGFAHPEYALWLRAQIQPRHANVLHALALERLEGRAEEFALAEHAFRAGKLEVAFGYALRAGENALKRLHYSLAERAFRLALETKAPVQPSLERRVRLGLADALNAMGQPEDAQVLWHALSTGSDETARRSRLQLAEWHSARGEIEAALEWLGSDTSLEARLARAKTALRAGNTDLAWREGLGAYRLEPGNAEALLSLANVTTITGRHERGLLLSRAALSRSEDSLVNLRARNFEASALLGLREFGAAQVIFEDIAVTAGRIGHLWLQLSALNNIAIVLFYEERIFEALQRYQQAHALSRRVDDAESEAVTATNVVETLVMLGRLEEALEFSRPYAHATARLWTSHLATLLNADPVPLPPRAQVSAWYQSLYELTEVARLLRGAHWSEAFARIADAGRDYAWWWDLYELNARLRLQLTYTDTLERLKYPKPNAGIASSVALECAHTLEAHLSRGESLPSASAWLLFGGVLR